MSQSNPLASFPSKIRDAHQNWVAQRDFASLDTVVLAIVAFHRPNRSSVANPDDLPDSAQLIADLGYDSLALAEIVFFVEELYQISIANEDLLKLQTIGDLRTYVHAKVTAPAAAAPAAPAATDIAPANAADPAP
jgi:acyl carrier protein